MLFAGPRDHISSGESGRLALGQSLLRFCRVCKSLGWWCYPRNVVFVRGDIYGYLNRMALTAEAYLTDTFIVVLVMLNLLSNPRSLQLGASSHPALGVDHN